jgi:hypothetical protein
MPMPCRSVIFVPGTDPQTWHPGGCAGKSHGEPVGVPGATGCGGDPADVGAVGGAGVDDVVAHPLLDGEVGDSGTSIVVVSGRNAGGLREGPRVLDSV